MELAADEDDRADPLDGLEGRAEAEEQVCVNGGRSSFYPFPCDALVIPYLISYTGNQAAHYVDCDFLPAHSCGHDTYIHVLTASAPSAPSSPPSTDWGTALWRTTRANTALEVSRWTVARGTASRVESEECGLIWSGLFVAPVMKTLFLTFMPSIFVRPWLRTQSPALQSCPRSYYVACQMKTEKTCSGLTCSKSASLANFVVFL